MIENDDGTFGLSEDEWAHEYAMMEICAGQDLLEITRSFADRAVLETKVKEAISLARSAATGNQQRLDWLVGLEAWFMEAVAAQGPERAKLMAENRAIVVQSFEVMDVVESFELKGEVKH